MVRVSEECGQITTTLWSSNRYKENLKRDGERRAQGGQV